MEPDFLEIKLEKEEDFLKVKETLERIGIANKEQDTLYQTAHILHKGGRYYIMHFKEMFLLDGKESNFSDEDRARRNTIVSLLQDWKLLTVINNSRLEPKTKMSKIKVVRYSDRDNWRFEPKYTIGKKPKIT